MKSGIDIDQIEPVDEINLSKYFMLLWHHKWIIVIIVLLSVVGTGRYLMKVQKTYLARGTILPMDVQGGALASALGALPFATLSGGGSTSSDKLMIVLQSRTIAKEVVQKLELVRSLEIINGEKKDSALFSLLQKLAGFFNKDQQDNGIKDPVMDYRIKEDRTINFLKGKTLIEQNKNGLVEIKVEWFSPKISAKIVNVYLSSLNEFLNNYSLAINYQVIDAAVAPTYKFKPKITQTLIVVIAVSLILSIFIIFIKDAVVSSYKQK